ncbi:anti-sigma factor [Cellulomonas sp.]|uniref:anti-sigma factor n=1 Tax=Cellulomonas sp. TaxID=40001 RepID=UPI001B2BCC32|nr:anti-sigma factor [Cellulomonas sp.]MBO9556346.1 anti-sigma factor [Cellulomonas sp.]
MRSGDEHVDDETLTLLALGEDITADDRAHVAACARCTAELDALADVTDLARSAGDLVAPAPHVWDAVAAELGLGAQARPTTSTAKAGTATATSTTTSTATTPPARRAGSSDSPGAEVVPLAPRRRGRWGWVAAGAAAGLLVGAAVTWGLVDRTPATDVVATATLDPLPGWDAIGSAEVEEHRDGSRVLVVDLDGDVDSQGFREVWLLRPDVSGLVSLGTLEGSSGRFDLPAGLDLHEFSVVDVSEEQFDGNPAHSGDSIVRGPLRA